SRARAAKRRRAEDGNASWRDLLGRTGDGRRAGRGRFETGESRRFVSRPKHSTRDPGPGCADLTFNRSRCKVDIEDLRPSMYESTKLRFESERNNAMPLTVPSSTRRPEGCAPPWQTSNRG